MKSASFGDRARQVAAWFQDWTRCEQTIVLYSLLSKVSATQAHFLCLILDHRLKNSADSKELSKMETESNNPAYLHSLHSESEDYVLGQLLSHLLLLHPGNQKAREEFLRLLPKVLLSSSEDPDYLDHCQQLLSLALVHPAFPQEERATLTHWRSRLEEKCRTISSSTLSRKSNTFGPSSSSSLPPNSAPRRIYQTGSNRSDDLISLSVAPNGANRIYIDGTVPGQLVGSNTLSLSNGFHVHSNDLLESDSFPLEEEDEIISKTGSLQPRSSPSNHHLLHHSTMDNHRSSGSNTDDYYRRVANKTCSLPAPRIASAHLPGFLGDEIYDWKAGMKDVPQWLKSLRLHKYQHLFADMTYEEFLTLSEEYLESKNVTKGARNKIILSIRKLQKRPETLAAIEQEVEKHGQLLSCIYELRKLVVTPIKQYSPPQDNATTASEAESTKTVTVGEKDEHNDAARTEEGGGGSSSGGSSCSSPSSSPCLRRSSSVGSDLDELLAREFPQEDLPSLITRTIGKVFSQLMKYTDTNEDNLSSFIKLLDNSMCHEAFTVDQRKLFFEWKQQCQQTLKVILPRRSPRSHSNWGGAFTFAGYPSPNSPNSPGRGGVGVIPRGRKTTTMRTSSANKGMVAVQIGGSTLPRMNPRQIQQPPLPPPLVVRPKSVHLMNPLSKPFVPPPYSARTHKYVNLTIPSQQPDINEDMDDLCKRVTEHALDEHSEF